MMSAAGSIQLSLEGKVSPMLLFFLLLLLSFLLRLGFFFVADLIMSRHSSLVLFSFPAAKARTREKNEEKENKITKAFLSRNKEG